MSTTNQTKRTLVPIAIIAGVFFIFGFVTWINGALIPFMKTINELTDAQSYLVASASYISFVLIFNCLRLIFKFSFVKKILTLVRARTRFFFLQNFRFSK